MVEQPVVEPVRYENGLAVQGDLLLEVLDKKCGRLQLPMYIHRIAADAMNGISGITVSALAVGQVESWAPLLRAQRSVLQIWNPEDEARIWLPLSHTGGFDTALTAEESGRRDTLPFEIDFEAYDRRFLRIQDRDLKLDMAISRLLYPVHLTEKARSGYEQLLKNRFRPAMLQLVSGRWNWYGKIPKKADELLSLKKMDRFLQKELLEKAVSCNQPELVDLLTPGMECRFVKNDTDGMEKAETKAWARCIEKDSCQLKEEVLGDQTVQANLSAHELWKLAEQELCRRRPIMEAFCGLLTVKQISGCCGGSDIGTDGEYIYYTREAMQKTASYGRETLARLYAHMLVHCIYGHPFYGHLQDKAFHLACDIAAGYVVDQIFGPDRENFMERQQVYDLLLQQDPVLTADRIRDRIILKDTQIDRLMELFSCDCHIFWHEESRCADSIINKNQNGISGEYQKKWQASVRKWSAAGEGFLQAGEKKTGKCSPAAGHEQEKAGLKKRKGYDYHDFLRQFMVLREDRILDLDSYDPVYYTYGLNAYGNIPLVEPLETKEVMRLEELVIVIDTSGSCSGRLVRFFLEETWSVFSQSENFFDQFHIRILQCDAIVQEDVKLTSLQEAEHYMKNLVIKGGGGTDFRPAFSHIRQLQKQGELMHLKGILYFTDGFGTFPSQAPGCKTAFIFLKARFGQVEVPCWAEKLLLELPEGADWEPEYTGGFRGNILR